jgi:hypothetical protein
MATLITCPTCHQQFDPAQSRAMPFCSPRCKQIDLGRWLNEDISIPFREKPDDHGWGVSSEDEEPRR